MLKSLFATCLTALSFNTQPLALSPSLEPSWAISEVTTFNVGDIYLFSYTLDITHDITINIFGGEEDSGINTISFTDFTIIGNARFDFGGSKPFAFDSGSITTGSIVDFNNYQRFSIIELDNDNDIDCYISLLSFNGTLSITFTFEILEGFEGFSSEALPYLTKVEKPYTPPAKSNLYRLLYDFYYSIFNDDDLTAITTGYNMPFDNWLAHTCTIATLITLIVVAFFFLRWLFRVISGLVLLKR